MTAPAPLSVTLVMDEQTHTALQRDVGALESAQAYVIDSHDMATLANDDLKAVKARIAVVEQWKEGFVSPAKQIIANAAALFNPALENLRAAEVYHKTNLAKWTTEQRRIADEAVRKQAAEDRERRQKAEAEAAAARAKAEEQAAEQRRVAAEAEKKRLQAVAEGNAKVAAQQAALAAKATEAAHAAVETGEAKATEAIVSAAAAAPAAVEAAKIAGFSMSDHWVAEIAPDCIGDADAMERIVCAIAGVKTLDGRRDLLSLLTLDMKAACALAKAQKRLMSVPGLVAMNRPVSRSRAA